MPAHRILSVSALAASLLAAPAVSARVVQVEFSGTYDLFGTVFGLTGFDVPYSFSLVYDTDLAPSPIFEPAGTQTNFPDNSTLGQDFYGYDAGGIVSFDFTFGTKTFTISDLNTRPIVLGGPGVVILSDQDFATTSSTPAVILSIEDIEGLIGIGRVVASPGPVRSLDATTSLIFDNSLFTDGASFNMNTTFTVLSPATDGTNFPGEYPDGIIAVQTLQTQFGDNTLSTLDTADGSEINGLLARIENDTLYLMITGNLESNFNKLELFFDSVPGGQNQLRGDNPEVSFNGLNRMGSNGTDPGLKFDAGFEADRYITISCGNDPVDLFASYAEVLTTGGGVGRFLGSGTPGGDGTLSGGDNPDNIRIAINNSNTVGVTAGTSSSQGSSATTGVELAIPLAALGINNNACNAGATDIKVCAFINSVDQDFVANQFLFPLPTGTANLGEPRTIDLSAITLNQFVPIMLPAPPTDIVQDGPQIVCPIGLYRARVGPAGSMPFAYQWQFELASDPGTWIDFTEGTTQIEPGVSVGVSGAIDSLFDLNVIPGTTSNININIRCVVTNECGTNNSDIANFTFCPGDFSCDGTNAVGDILDFLSAWSAQTDPRADFNADSSYAVGDILDFLAAWSNGCP